MKALLFVIGFGYPLLVTAYFILRPRALVKPESKIAAVWKPLLIFSLEEEVISSHCQAGEAEHWAAEEI
jgi:hypothetical protein